MNNLKLLIYDFNQLYKILEEIKKDINIDVVNISDADLKKKNGSVPSPDMGFNPSSKGLVTQTPRSRI